MPTGEAAGKLGMTFEDGYRTYPLCYSNGGDRLSLDPSETPKDYATTLTLYLSGGVVHGIILCEKQYGLTGQ